MNVINAQWPAPSNICAITTTRMGGVSQGDCATLNLASHVGDNPAHVATNRKILYEGLDLPSEPIWLNQTHSTTCVEVDVASDFNADAAISRQKNHVLAIMTADCLPILICDHQGSEIAAIHAGWRGLAMGIVENTLAKMHANLNHCMAWIGPAICGRCYATGPDVLDQFSRRYPYASEAFTDLNGQWYADLPKLATSILQHSGLQAVYSSQLCTFEADSPFYSYRRSPQTGRIASLIWFKEGL